MSRFTSLRSLWTTARSGILCSIFIVLGYVVYPVFAQDKIDYAAMDEGMGGYYDEPSDMMRNGAQQQSATITNIGSSIVRPDNYSSLNAIQALLYSDTVSVFHFNATKIDYEGLSSFLDEIIDKGAGAVNSSDRYRVDLREYQKNAIKSSFKRLLSTLQNVIVQAVFANNIDELYVIKYANNDPKILGATIVAIPTDGMSESDIKKTIDYLNTQSGVLSIFIRYNFIIAVTEHDAASEFDPSDIEARYQAKLQQSMNRNSYGAYGSSANMNKNNGSFMDFRAGHSSSSNSTDQLLRDYQNELLDAQRAYKTASRREVLPRLRNRFSSPATLEESAPYMKGLALTNGAALTFTTKSFEALLESFDLLDEKVDSPFAGLGSSQSSKNESQFGDLLSFMHETVEAQSVGAESKAVTLAISLVGSPRFVLFLGFATPEEAKSGAVVFETILAAIKPMFLKSLQDSVSETGGDVAKEAVSSLINKTFSELKPRVVDSVLAIVLSLDPIKDSPSALMSLLGGEESVPQQQIEADTIDWSLGEDSDVFENQETGELDDLFDDNEVDNSSSSEGEEEEEEDPFA